MFSYIMRRLMFGALTVVGVSIVVFVVMRILPGDPLVAIFGPEGFTKLTDRSARSYMAELGLSDPLWSSTGLGRRISRAATSAARSSAPKAWPR